jgi:hypothetical protein
MILILFNILEQDLQKIKTEYFNNIKLTVKEKLKNDYFVKIDDNDLNIIDTIKTLSNLREYLSHLERKYQIIDYNYILLLKNDKNEIKEKRYDNGIDTLSGKYIPGSPALKYCYYFSNKIFKNLQPENYEVKKNDVCFYNNNVFISSYEINEEFVNILISLSESGVYYDTLVIDLIENPGGLLDASNIAIALLTGEQNIVQNLFFRDTIFKLTTLVIVKNYIKYNTLIFLSNKNSASASEYIMFKTYEILKNQKVEIINKDKRTIGKRTVQMVLDVGINEDSLLSLKDSITFFPLNLYFPTIIDTSYLMNIIKKTFQEYIDLQFIYTIYVLIYYDPFNKETNKRIKEIEKRAKYIKDIFTFLIYINHDND